MADVSEVIDMELETKQNKKCPYMFLEEL